jgi:glycosyltransferase involved in cell wall biosynthesis
LDTRIVRLITRLNIGGPSIQAVSLSDRLRVHGFETVLAHGRLGPGEGDMRYLLPASVEAELLPELQRSISPVEDLQAARRVLRLLHRVRPSILHTHMAKAGAVGRIAAVIYNRGVAPAERIRLVHTYHGHVLEGYFSPLKTAVFIRTERALARATDRLIAISPQIQRDLLHTHRIGRDGQYAVVPLGFDLTALADLTEADRASARVSLDIASEALVVSTVGRLTAIKQHELFLEAARRIHAAEPRALFLVVGDGERRAELEQMARALGVDAQVRFVGWRRDLDVIYGATDVFALTSRNEGTPVALIESMASGVPGVSTDVGGVGDVIADSGMGRRVPDGDPDAFARAVIDLLRLPERGEMGARARRHVLARYGLDRLVTDIAALYRQMLATRAI